jgi:hypothetical protein
MIKIAGAPRVKSRVPLMAWVVAVLVTLLSITSSLTHTTPNSAVTGMEPKAHHASAN